MAVSQHYRAEDASGLITKCAMSTEGLVINVGGGGTALHQPRDIAHFLVGAVPQPSHYSFDIAHLLMLHRWRWGGATTHAHILPLGRADLCYGHKPSTSDTNGYEYAVLDEQTHSHYIIWHCGAIKLVCIYKHANGFNTIWYIYTYYTSHQIYYSNE